MYKPPGNPQAIELQKTWRERRINASDILNHIVDGTRYCAYCAAVPTKGKRKYCSNICQTSLYAWASPQKEEGLSMLLMRQDWKCNICLYDYVPLVNQILINGRVYDKPDDFKTQYSYSLIKRIKSKSEKGRKPEVDHIIPVAKGGESIGLSNHQAICFACHKAKTKIDNSGPRKKPLT